MNYSDFFSEELEKLKNQGLYRKFRQINRNKNSFPEAIEICDSSRRKIEIWCTNDYLNMSRHPQVLEAAVKVIREYGTGSGGTRNISGTTSYHVDLENELASFHQKESALLFSSAYTANQSSLWVLCKKIKDITVYSDELNHASLIQGIKTSGAKCKIFRHNDLEHLEELLRQEPLYSPKLIVFESLYSMEGIYSPMKGIINLAKKYGSLTYLDEVHSVGLYGPEGRGIAAEQGVSDQIDIINATLSKAFGQFGGYIAARRELIDFVRCFSPGFIFTTSLVPAIAAASLESIQIVKTANESRTKLKNNSDLLREYLTGINIPYINNSSHIIPIMIDGPEICKEVSRILLEEYGIYIQPIFYPTVPQGKERLRVTITPLHTKKVIEPFAVALDQVWSRLELRRTSQESKVTASYV